MNWDQRVYILNRLEQLELQGTKCSGGIYAPTIRYDKGHFYIVATHVSKGNLLLTSGNLENGWYDPIYLREIKGLDPSLYFEEGKAYLHYAGFTDDFKQQLIRMVEIEIQTRQRGWNGSWEVTIKDREVQDECELSLYMNHEHHMDFDFENTGK